MIRTNRARELANMTLNFVWARIALCFVEVYFNRSLIRPSTHHDKYQRPDQQGLLKYIPVDAITAYLDIKPSAKHGDLAAFVADLS